jgi:carbonic anhydrase
MNIPENSNLVLDLRKSHKIDPDILEMIETYKVLAEVKNITVEINQ